MYPVLNLTNEEKRKIASFKGKFPDGMQFDYNFHDRGTRSDEGQKEYCFSINANEKLCADIELPELGRCLIITDFVVFSG